MTPESADRRRFFARAVRYMVLGGMTVLAGGQVIKSRRLKGDPECIRLHTCAACLEFRGCGKSKAVAFREMEGRV